MTRHGQYKPGLTLIEKAVRIATVIYHVRSLSRQNTPLYLSMSRVPVCAVSFINVVYHCTGPVPVCTPFEGAVAIAHNIISSARPPVEPFVRTWFYIVTYIKCAIYIRYYFRSLLLKSTAATATTAADRSPSKRPTPSQLPTPTCSLALPLAAAAYSAIILTRARKFYPFIKLETPAPVFLPLHLVIVLLLVSPAAAEPRFQTTCDVII